MIASSSHRLRQKHLRRRASSSGEQGDGVQDAARSASGGGARPQDRPPTTSPGPSHESAAFQTALEDPDSELARFLLCDDDGATGDGSERAMRGIGSMRATFYALALEPVEVRNERAIMIFEAYAIFGALFAGASWTIYEWGRADEGSAVDDAGVDRAFEFVMALAICFNLFLALFGANCWVGALIVESSNQDFTFHSRKMFAFLHYLMVITAWLVELGLCIGIYKNLSPNWPETIITLTIAIVLKFGGETYFGRDFLQTCLPLEFWHFPRWMQFIAGPQGRGEREQLEARARLRARELRTRAHRVRRRLDPDLRDGDGADSVGALLRVAAANLGRNDLDTSIYESRLEEDLFDEVHHLKGRSVECLSRYMPLRLAEQVHALVEAQEDSTS